MAQAAAILTNSAVVTRRRTVRWTAVACVVLAAAVTAGLTMGPVSLPIRSIFAAEPDTLQGAEP